MTSERMNFPETINGWKLTGPALLIDRQSIFDYMNGAGELYLSYKFENLTVYEYRHEDGNEILVEIYRMESLEEAFGLLSLDWHGEPTVLNSAIPEQPENPIFPSTTALYAEGLLRARVNNLYLRILSFKESPGVKDIILRLAKVIAERMTDISFPELGRIVNPEKETAWKIKKERTAYFHNHLVLNSLFYLSHENILKLDLSTEGLFLTLERQEAQEKQTASLVILKYPESSRADEALNSFIRNYLPDKTALFEDAPNLEKDAVVQVEDGYLGWKLRDNYLALVFQCPAPEVVKEILRFANF